MLHLPAKRRNHLIDWIIITGCLSFATWLMFHTLSYKDGNFIFASKVWSDFGAHIPLIRSFSHGSNWPPEYPTYPGEPIRYHYGFYLIAALLEKAGLNLALALNLPSILGFSLLLILIYQVTKRYFRSHLAGCLALLLFLFNGSLTFIEFFKKFPPNPLSFIDIITNQHFVSFGPWDGKWVSAFWNLNIYTNQRHLALSFALALLALYPLVLQTIKKTKPKPIHYVTVFISLLILPYIHQAGYVIALIVGFGLIAASPKSLKRTLPFGLLFLITALPGFLITQSMRQGTPMEWHLGFLARDQQPLTIITYWLYNLGAYLLLFPVIFIFSPRPIKKVLLAVLPLFILANVARLSPDMINNHKLINFFQMTLCIATAGFLSRLLKSKKIIPKLLFFPLFVSLTLSGFIDFFPVLNDVRSPFPDIQNTPAAAWIDTHTPKNSIFITTVHFYNPASLAGRKTFVDYGYFNWSMGYNDQPRRLIVKNILSEHTPPASICQLLTTNHITHIMIAPGKGEVSDNDPHNSVFYQTFSPVYTSDNQYQIYETKQICQP